MFRIGRSDEDILDVDSVEKIEPAIRSSPPGRYHIDEIIADPLPSGHTPRRHGAPCRRRDKLGRARYQARMSVPLSPCHH
jgi:hypothetical protein